MKFYGEIMEILAAYDLTGLLRRRGSHWLLASHGGQARRRP